MWGHRIAGTLLTARWRHRRLADEDPLEEESAEDHSVDEHSCNGETKESMPRMLVLNVAEICKRNRKDSLMRQKA